MSRISWTKEEDDFLIENYPLLGVQKTSEKLFELFGTRRSAKSICFHKRNICISKGIEIIHVDPEVHKKIKHAWTPEEDQFIIEHSGVFSAKKISEMMFEIFGIKRSEESIMSRMYKLRKHDRIDFYTCVPWTEEEDNIIRQFYPKYGFRKTIQEIYEKTGNKRTKYAVQGRAHLLKLQGPSRAKEVGTISVRSNGDRNVKLNYIKIQKDDDTYEWVKYHRYITNADENERVLFLNRNHLDTRPENMVCVSASNASTLIASKYYSTESEITKTGVMLCELIQALKDQEKGESNGGNTET